MGKPPASNEGLGREEIKLHRSCNIDEPANLTESGGAGIVFQGWLKVRQAFVTLILPVASCACICGGCAACTQVSFCYPSGRCTGRGASLNVSLTLSDVPLGIITCYLPL